MKTTLFTLAFILSASQAVADDKPMEVVADQPESTSEVAPVKKKGKHNFDDLLNETRTSEQELEAKVKSENPPQTVSEDGLATGKNAQMKKVVIDGTEETVVSPETRQFFRESKRRNSNKDHFERLSKELDP